MTLVEATAGNTGVGLALVVAVRGYKLACVLESESVAGPLFDLYRRAADRMPLVRGKFRLGGFDGPLPGRPFMLPGLR